MTASQRLAKHALPLLHLLWKWSIFALMPYYLSSGFRPSGNLVKIKDHLILYQNHERHANVQRDLSEGCHALIKAPARWVGLGLDRSSLLAA